MKKLKTLNFFRIYSFTLMFTLLNIGVANSQQKVEDDFKAMKVIKFDVVGLAGDWVTNSSGVCFGLEYGLKPKMSFEQDFTYLFDAENGQSIFNILVEELSGIRSNTELHYYFDENTSSNLTGLYWGPNFVFQYTNAERKQLTASGYNSYTVHRYFTALYLKIGFQDKLFGNLLINISVGAGPLYLSSTSDNKQKTYITESEYPYGKEYDAGSKWELAPSFNLRVGWRF